MSYILTPDTTLDTPVSVANGGTSASSPAFARDALGAAVNGANGDITSLTATTEISNASLKLGALMGALSFYGADVAPQGAASNGPLTTQGSSYSQAGLNASLDSLEAGINQVITALQTVGLIA